MKIHQLAYDENYEYVLACGTPCSERSRWTRWPHEITCEKCLAFVAKKLDSVRTA